MMKRINYKKRAVIHGLSMAVFLGACLGVQAIDHENGVSAQATVNTDRSSASSSTDRHSDHSYSVSTDQNANGKLSHGDTSFIKEAAQGGLMEVKMGQTAKDHGQNEDVKNYGEMLVKDHSKANDRLTQLATSKGVNLAKEIEPKHAAAMKDIENKSGADFDRAFIQDAIKDHRKDIAKFEKASRDLNDSELKAFATETLPTLRNHLAEAERIAKSMGVNVEARNIDYSNSAAESSAAAAAGAPGLSTSQENSSVNHVDINSNIDANNKDRNPGGRIDLDTTHSRDNGVDVNINGNDVNKPRSSNTGADVNVDTSKGDGKTLGVDTQPRDHKVLGITTKPGDGKTLGLNTRKDDGKILGLFPAPGHHKASSGVDVDVNRNSASVDVNADHDASIGAPASSEKGSSSANASYDSDNKNARNLTYNDVPSKVQDTIKSHGGSSDVKSIRKHTSNGQTVYTVKLNHGTLRVSEDGTVLKDSTK
jgi:putative membrane protein